MSFYNPAGGSSYYELDGEAMNVPAGASASDVAGTFVFGGRLHMSDITGYCLLVDNHYNSDGRGYRLWHSNGSIAGSINFDGTYDGASGTGFNSAGYWAFIGMRGYFSGNYYFRVRCSKYLSGSASGDDEFLSTNRNNVAHTPDATKIMADADLSASAFAENVHLSEIFTARGAVMTDAMLTRYADGFNIFDIIGAAGGTIAGYWDFENSNGEPVKNQAMFNDTVAMPNANPATSNIRYPRRRNYDTTTPILAGNTQRRYFGGAVVRNGFIE